ncbi:MAG: RHS repeat-associated core domain-containing protein, partial [Methylobacter sp.]
YGHNLQKTQTTGPVTLTSTNSYNAVTGQLMSTVLPSKHVIAYSYDLNGNVSSVTADSVPAATQITYDPFGPQKAWAQGNSGTMVHQRITDLDDRLSDIEFTNKSAPTGLEIISLTRDLGGRITQITDNTVAAKTFTYDALNEITGYATTGLVRSYAYDANGNRTQASYTTPAISVTNAQIDTASNRLLSSTANTVTNYTLDAAGNLTGDGSRSFTYNASGRLAQAKVGSITMSYFTNGLGERVAKYSPAVGATVFTQDANGNITGEYDINGAPMIETVYLGNLPVGVLVAGTLYPMNPDHLGAPRTAITNTGVPVWTWDHDPFGNGEPSINGYNLRFPGQYYDAETGLYHNNARDYDRTTGRYIQSDPIGLMGGNNTYGYVGGNPVSYTDVHGLIFNPLELTCIDPAQPVCWVGVAVDVGSDVIPLLSISAEAASTASAEAAFMAIERGILSYAYQAVNLVNTNKVLGGIAGFAAVHYGAEEAPELYGESANIWSQYLGMAAKTLENWEHYESTHKDEPPQCVF